MEEQKAQINWVIKLLLRFWPKLAMRYFAREMGIKNPLFDKAHKLFTGTERIDIFPAQSARGFILILDRKTSLHFYQDGDHFVYDGFEMGEYEKGDVTIFDRIKSEEAKNVE